MFLFKLNLRCNCYIFVYCSVRIHRILGFQNRRLNAGDASYNAKRLAGIEDLHVLNVGKVVAPDTSLPAQQLRYETATRSLPPLPAQKKRGDFVCALRITRFRATRG